MSSNYKFYFSLLASLFSVSLMAAELPQGCDANPNEMIGPQANQRLITVNKANQSSKESVLALLKILLRTSYAFHWEDYPFGPSSASDRKDVVILAHIDPELNPQTRDAVLLEIVQLEGVTISCRYRPDPLPAVSGGTL